MPHIPRKFKQTVADVLRPRIEKGKREALPIAAPTEERKVPIVEEPSHNCFCCAKPASDEDSLVVEFGNGLNDKPQHITAHEKCIHDALILLRQKNRVNSSIGAPYHIVFVEGTGTNEVGHE